jgi:hypothetical protein
VTKSLASAEKLTRKDVFAVIELIRAIVAVCHEKAPVTNISWVAAVLRGMAIELKDIADNAEEEIR